MNVSQGFILACLLLTGAVTSEARQDQSLPVSGAWDTLMISTRFTSSTCRNIPMESGPQGALKSAICKYHEAQRLGTSAGKRSARQELWHAAIDDLNQAQTQGLPGNEQAFAALMEGLAHCGLAQDILQASTPGFDPGKVSASQYTMFCSSRRQALASFADVNWSLMNAEYESRDLTLDQRFTEMSGCYEGPLSESYDSACGITGQLPEETVDSIVEQETEAALYQAFDSAGAPVDQLISSKIEKTRTVIEDIWKELTGCSRSVLTNASDPDSSQCRAAPLPGSLEAQANQVAKQHGALRDAMQRIEPRVDSMVQSYRQAILSGYMVLDEYNRWKDGLFDSSFKLTLQQKLGDLTAVEQQFRRKDAITGRSLVNDAKGLGTAVQRLVRSAQNRGQTIKSLCQVVFCEFYEWNRLDEDTVPACTESGLTDNPLCVNANYDPHHGGTISVRVGGRTLTQKVVDLCIAAGLPAAYATIGIDEPRACFANYSLPE